jgi:hypothetical protein
MRRSALLVAATLLHAGPGWGHPPNRNAEPQPDVRLVVERREGASSIALCAASRTGLRAATLEEERLVHARGGILHREPGRDVPWDVDRAGNDERDAPGDSAGMPAAVRCVSLPVSELPLGLWLGRQWTGARDGSPPRTARARARTRLAELASPETASRVDLGAVIAIVGELDPSEVLAGIGPGASLHVRAPPPPNTDRQRSERLSVLRDTRIEAPEVHIGYPLSGASPADLASLGVIAAILGASPSSRLPSLVVRRRGRATHAFAWFDAPAGVPLLGLSVTIAVHSTVDRVERFIEGTLKQLRLVGPSARELAAGQRTFVNRLLHLVEPPDGHARLLAQLALCGAAIGPVSELVEHARRTTPERVRETVKRYLVATRRSVVEVYPPDWPIDDPTLSDFTLYTVVEGDTWQELGKRFGVPASEILRANEFDPRYRPTPGEALWIPPARGSSPDRPR